MVSHLYTYRFVATAQFTEPLTETEIALIERFIVESKAPCHFEVSASLVDATESTRVNALTRSREVDGFGNVSWTVRDGERVVGRIARTCSGYEVERRSSRAPVSSIRAGM